MKLQLALTITLMINSVAAMNPDRNIWLEEKIARCKEGKNRSCVLVSRYIEMYYLPMCGGLGNYYISHQHKNSCKTITDALANEQFLKNIFRDLENYMGKD